MKRINVQTVITLFNKENVDWESYNDCFTDFYFKYNRYTKIKRLLKRACKMCHCADDDYKIRFQLIHKDKFYFLNPEVRLVKLLKFLKINKSLKLEFVIGVPGGGTIDEINGIRYYLQPKETNHTPHIHAIYSGVKISIDLLNGKTKGDFKNIKKMKEAKKYASEHKVELIEKYNLFTNGINVFI